MTMSCVVTNMIETTAAPHKDDPLGKAKQSSFPAGLRVLLVDDDPVCLMVIGQMLRHCQYEVCTCSAATKALDQLRDKSHNFDLVLSDVYMPDMDGFKLLEVVGLELGLPVIMMSANDEHTTVMRGVTHGACDFLIKPVRIEELKNIWQHVVRRSRHNATMVRDAESDDAPGDQDADSSRKRNVHSRDGSCNAEQQREDEGGANKKPRVVWSVEMHQQFVQAVNQLGIDKAVPKKILELMKVDGLTRENVASHLQKYRLYLKRVQQNAPAQGSNGGATAAAAAGGSGAFSSSMGLAAPGMVASNQMMWGNSKQLMDAMQAQQQAAAATVQQAAAGQQQLMQQQQPPPQQQQQALAGQPGMGPDGMGNMLGLMPGGGLMSPVGQLLPGVNMGMGGMPGLSGMGPMSGMSQPGAAAGGMMGLPGMSGAGFGGMMGFMPGMPGLPGTMAGMPGAMNPLGLSGMRAGMPGAPNDTSAVMAMMSTAANMQAAMFAQQAAAQQAAAAAAAALPTNSGGGSNGGVMPPLQPQSQPQQQQGPAAALASPPASAGPAGLVGMAGAVKAEAAAMGGLAGMQGAGMAANGQRAAALQATAAGAAALAQQRVPAAGLQTAAGLLACSNNANGVPAAMAVPGQPAAATAAMNMHDYSNMFDDVLDVAGPTGGAAAAAAAAAQHAHGVDAAPDDYLIDFLLKGP